MATRRSTKNDVTYNDLADFGEVELERRPGNYFVGRLVERADNGSVIDTYLDIREFFTSRRDGNLYPGRNGLGIHTANEIDGLIELLESARDQLREVEEQRETAPSAPAAGGRKPPTKKKAPAPKSRGKK